MMTMMMWRRRRRRRRRRSRRNRRKTDEKNLVKGALGLFVALLPLGSESATKSPTTTKTGETT
jgi:hypothetical protein